MKRYYHGKLVSDTISYKIKKGTMIHTGTKVVENEAYRVKTYKCHQCGKEWKTLHGIKRPKRS